MSAVTNSPIDTRYRQGRRAAENVERALLADIAPLLPGFVAGCDMAQMLYMTPLLVTTLSHYPEELSIQLQLVEAMHRIIHLPLSCWTDVLTREETEEGKEGDPYGNTVVKASSDDADDTAPDDTASNHTPSNHTASKHTASKHAASNASHQKSTHDGMFTPVKSTPPADTPPPDMPPADTPAEVSHSGHSGIGGRDGDGESPSRHRKHTPSGLLYVSRDPQRKYASCCTPLRGQRRYAYLRPQLMEGDETALVLEQAASASPSPHQPGAHETGGSLSKAHTRAFEQVCEAFVGELLRIVELQNTEIALFRAVLVSFLPHSSCCLTFAIHSARAHTHTWYVLWCSCILLAGPDKEAGVNTGGVILRMLRARRRSISAAHPLLNVHSLAHR